MPLIERSRYKPPLLFGCGQIQTFYPSLFRKVDFVKYTRERIEIPDGDFLDLDWSYSDSARRDDLTRKLVVISHGLGGNAQRPYVMGMVKALNNCKYDVVAWNFRACGGEINRLLKFTHNGSTDDLESVVNHARQTGKYDSISLIGFSMGGNLTLNYLGIKRNEPLLFVKNAVVISAPCDLAGSAERLSVFSNRLYLRRFLKQLHEIVKGKVEQFPGKISDRDYHMVKNFKDFDDRYTAPMHGFKNAEDYWEKCSSIHVLQAVSVPTLIINAANDPFLSASCYPVDQAESNSNLYLEIPRSGGHVGFIEFNHDNLYWSEKRAIEFLGEV